MAGINDFIVAIQYLPWLRFPQMTLREEEMICMCCRNPVFTLAKIPTYRCKEKQENKHFTVAIQYLPWLRFPLFQQTKRQSVGWQDVAIQYLPWLRFPLLQKRQLSHNKKYFCRNPVFTLAKIPTFDLCD